MGIFSKKAAKRSNALAYRKPKRLTVRGYAAATIDRLTASFKGSGLSADGDLVSGLPTLRSRARQLFNDVDFARRFISLCQQNIVGPNGIKLQARLINDQGQPDPADSAKLESAFLEWGYSCDVAGRMAWPELQRLVIATVARDGECLVRLHPQHPSNKHGLALQVLETDYLDENLNQDLRDGGRIAMGVEKDKLDMPVAYFLSTRTTPTSSGDVFTFNGRNYVRVPAAQILHIFKADRPQQSRGVTWMVSALRRLNMLSALEEASLVAQRVAAAKMGFFTSPTADEYTGTDTDGEGGAVIDDVEPGSFTQLPDGVGFTSFEPNAPDIYPALLAGLLRGAAAGLGVGYASLSMDNTSANYSSLRQEALADQDHWRTLQRWFTDEFVRPVYEAWIVAAFANDALPFPPRKLEKYRDRQRVLWQPRGWSWVDPAKEAKGNTDAVTLGIISRREIAASQGRDLEEVFGQLAEEEALAASMGITITKEAAKPGGEGLQNGQAE